MIPTPKSKLTQTEADRKRAGEIIEGIIQYDAWRDNLHPNDLPTAKKLILDALAEVREEARNSGLEDAARYCEKMGIATGHPSFMETGIRVLKDRKGL